MTKEIIEQKDTLNLYLIKLTFDEAKPIVDTYKCQNIKEVLNYISNSYGFDWDDLRFFDIERLKKG